MKGSRRKKSNMRSSIIFISHMVQMKAIHSYALTFNEFNLYPTWFRWKRWSNNQIHFLTKIYIPHGSDESTVEGGITYDELQFISHMVQMKGCQRGAYGIIEKNLYPTWFRWKEDTVVRLIYKHFHLYPTWFRWKMTCRIWLPSL